MAPGDDEQVTEIYRLYVHEGRDKIILMDDACQRFATKDLTEDAVGQRRATSFPGLGCE
jgi:hypothetical protein